MIGERYELAHGGDPCFGDPRAIVAKNFLDLRMCDFTLAYLPKPPEATEFERIARTFTDTAAIIEDVVGPVDDEEAVSMRRDAATLKRIAPKSPQRSIGTIGEISWAYALQKPCAVVSDDPLIQAHPFTQVQPGWTLTTLDEAVRLLRGLFTDYL